MEKYIIGDEVVLQKNKEGFIRFKGKLPGKTGTFYGIELTEGTGKHNGDYDGVHYFDCAEGQGLFIQKKQIVFKLNESPNVSRKRSRKKSVKSKSSTTRRDGAGSQFVVKRKAGPNKKDKPKGWTAPSWTNDVLQDDGTSWTEERKAMRGKQVDLKDIYDRAGYLPFAQRKKFKSMGFTDAELDKMVSKWDSERGSKRKKKSRRKRATSSWAPASINKMERKKRSKSGRKKRSKAWESDSSDDSWDSEEEERRAKAEAKRRRMVEAERKRLEEDEERMRRELEEEADRLRADRMALREREHEMERKQKEDELEAMRKELERRKKEDDAERQRLREERLALRKEAEARERELEQRRRDEEEKLEAERLLLRLKAEELEREKKRGRQRSRTGSEYDSENEHHRRSKSGKRSRANSKRRRGHSDAANSDANGDGDDGGDSANGYGSGTESVGSGRGRSGRRRGRNPKTKGSPSTESDGDGDDDGLSDSESGRVRRRRGRNPKKEEKREYKIYFIVDIRMKKESELEDKIQETRKLRRPFAKIFGAEKKEHVFDIRTTIRPGGKAFKLEFGIKIATLMHPADYIQIFDELTSKDDPKIQDALQDALDLNTEPEIHIWEARYEKVEK